MRTVTPQLVAAGQPALVRLALTNEGRTPSGLLLLEDQVPYVLGARPRFVLEGIGHGWRRHVTYQVRSDVRGRFEIGPMSVRVSDPFGMVELGRSFRTSVPLTVTPRTVALPSIPLGGAWTGSGDNRPRSFASGSAEDVTVREYRRGDDLRRVHWRSSARVGELMVRREEQPWQSRATVFLDNRTRAHRGQGIASSLEAAVSAAASIAVNLSQRGFTVRLVTATGEDPGTVWHFREAELNTGPLLEALAVVQPTAHVQYDTGWLGRVGPGRADRGRPRRARLARPAGAAPDAPPRRLRAGRGARRRAVAVRWRPARDHGPGDAPGPPGLASRQPATRRPPRVGLAGARQGQRPQRPPRRSRPRRRSCPTLSRRWHRDRDEDGAPRDPARRTTAHRARGSGSRAG